ncbi:NeuD/PglB/VioB family sugar acetyltransferase [Knoellia sp. CPCC 206435]|uniref:NeuD/PglB/VioB family sugar acetyltransferase n=1 Tax=Knoellia terrae TaxID=3404797 RepID=UPI003B43B3DA
MVGASGFGRECLDVLDAMVADGAPLEVVGVVDDAPSSVNRDRLAMRGAGLLGSVAQFVAAGDRSVGYVLGVGHPQVRFRLVEQLDDAGFTAVSAAHPSAIIGSSSSIGPGAVVCAGVVVSTNVTLGRHVHLNPHVTVGHDAMLADFVSVNPGAVVSGEVTVGAGTLIGASATILQGLLVREDTVIGAGAVVTKNVPGGVIVTGVPARWRPRTEGQQ